MSTGRRRRPDTKPRQTISHYDIVLALIPATLLLTAITAQLLSIELPVALAAGAVLATIAVVDALFVHPPIGK